MKIGSLEIVALLVFALTVAGIIASSIHFGGRITTPRIPMQWGLDGNPTWYATRTIGLWWPLFFVLAMGLGMISLGLFSDAGKAAGFWVVVMLFPIIFALIQLWHFNMVARWASKQ